MKYYSLNKNNSEIKINIGLEVHIGIFSNTKTFSPTLIDDISWTSLGLIGTLPTININTLKSGFKLAHFLNMDLRYESITFDRKNYFYHDLPKGYQITQYFNPLGLGGFLILDSGKEITFKQLHLEEDTAIQTKRGHNIFLNFTRLGKPLLELVTEPVFNDFDEVKEFLCKLKAICFWLNISSAEYESGKIRIDLNISFTKENVTSPKMEVKNLNSLDSINKSINYLYEQFINAQNNQTNVNQPFLDNHSYTFSWVEKLSICEVMRRKSSANEYFYIPEFNIPTISIKKDTMQKIISEPSEWNNLFINKKLQIFSFAEYCELIKQELNDKEIKHIFSNFDIWKEINIIYSNLNPNTKNRYYQAYKWRTTILDGISKNIDNMTNTIKLIKLIEKNGKVAQKDIKAMFHEMIFNNLSPSSAFQKYASENIDNKDYLSKLFNEIMDEISNQLEKLHKNNNKLKNIVISMSMAKTSGKIDPTAMAKFFDENIFDYLKIKGY